MRVGELGRHVLDIGRQLRRDSEFRIKRPNPFDIVGSALLDDLQAVAERLFEQPHARGDDLSEDARALASASDEDLERGKVVERGTHSPSRRSPRGPDCRRARLGLCSASSVRSSNKPRDSRAPLASRRLTPSTAFCSWHAGRRRVRRKRWKAGSRRSRPPRRSMSRNSRFASDGRVHRDEASTNRPAAQARRQMCTAVLEQPRKRAPVVGDQQHFGRGSSIPPPARGRDHMSPVPPAASAKFLRSLHAVSDSPLHFST